MTKKLVWSSLSAEEKNRAVGEAYGVKIDKCPNCLDASLKKANPESKIGEYYCASCHSGTSGFFPYSTSLDACFALANGNCKVTIKETEWTKKNTKRWTVALWHYVNNTLGEAESDSLLDAMCIALLRFNGIEVSND